MSFMRNPYSFLTAACLLAASLSAVATVFANAFVARFVVLNLIGAALILLYNESPEEKMFACAPPVSTRAKPADSRRRDIFISYCAPEPDSLKTDSTKQTMCHSPILWNFNSL